MLAEFIVLFRESIEAALIIGIMLTYLHKTGNLKHERHVWLGTASGILASIAFAAILNSLYGGFGVYEELFEGIFMVIASVLVTWFMLWMLSQKNIAQKIRDDVKSSMASASSSALFTLAFVSIFREGAESVLFLSGIYFSTGSLSLISSFMGMAAAVLVGIAIFEYAKKIDLALFFKYTTILLALLAAGLLSQGVHELQEAKVIPTTIEHVYNINPPQNPDGSYPLMHEKGYVGSILKGLIGYDANPSLEQVIAYLGYLAGFFFLYKKQKG